MNRTISFLKSFFFEALLVIGFYFVATNYIGKIESPIVADGHGYYDYLPALFIHNDLSRGTLDEDPLKYERISSIGAYLDYNKGKVNKYPCGTALLQLPFFIHAKLSVNLEGTHDDGYQPKFQENVILSTLFYLFLGLIFLRKVLILYEIEESVIIFCQLLVVFGTSVVRYAAHEASFSHIYSFFAISAFVYFVRSYVLYKRPYDILGAFSFYGLIFLLRQPNILVVLMLPFLAGSFGSFKEVLASLFKKDRLYLFIGLILFLVISSLQLVVWYLQTGDFFVYSYQGEGFNFLDPSFYDILFSYRKGLFVYTPILLLACLSSSLFLLRKEYYKFFGWLFFFLFLTYFLSSWWCWYYGCSFGLRAYIDFYVFFFIPYALLMKRNTLWIGFKVILVLLSLFTIPLSLTQAYQYERFILHWEKMDENKYWQVFLETGDNFRGAVWKKEYDLSILYPEDTINIGDVYTDNVFVFSSDSLNNFENIEYIQVLVDSEFHKRNNSKITLSVFDLANNTSHYWFEFYLMYLLEKRTKEFHTGQAIFEIPELSDAFDGKLSVEIKNVIKEDHMSNLRLILWSKKQ